jgi:hypothetical protein
METKRNSDTKLVIVKVKVTLRLAVGQSVSKSWCRAPSGAHDQIFIAIWQLRSYFCGAPSLKRGRVCLLYMLLALASGAFLGSEFLGTRDHILLSQIWEHSYFPSIRIKPSPFLQQNHRFVLLITSRHGPHRKQFPNSSYIVASRGYRTDRVENTVSQLLHFCMLRMLLWPLPSNGRCLQSHYLATAVV